LKFRLKGEKEGEKQKAGPYVRKDLPHNIIQEISHLTSLGKKGEGIGQCWSC
jgi:hypothetical protein